MEIKHTIEILTKDIQDIEKLVRNLNNNPVPSSIELDLALSKLRHVYELLLMIRADSITELDVNALLEDEKRREPEPEKPAGPTGEIPKTDTPSQEDRQPAAQPPEPQPSAQPAPQTDPASAESKPEVNKLTTPADSRGDAPEESKEREPSESKEKEDRNSEESVSLEKKKKEAAILAEKFRQEKSINERSTTDELSNVSSRLSGSPIDSIARNIGINDRFQIIRELLDGDSEAYASFIRKLDSTGNFNDAYQIIETRFPDDMQNESIRLLVNLARRRYLNQGNV